MSVGTKPWSVKTIQEYARHDVRLPNGEVLEVVATWPNRAVERAKETYALWHERDPQAHPLEAEAAAALSRPAI
jgi:hypothetical protein